MVVKCSDWTLLCSCYGVLGGYLLATIDTAGFSDLIIVHILPLFSNFHNWRYHWCLQDKCFC